jgi:hypothetical protein
MQKKEDLTAHNNNTEHLADEVCTTKYLLYRLYSRHTVSYSKLNVDDVDDAVGAKMQRQIK